MKTSEIRDKLLEQRALYNQSVQASNVAIKQIRDILDSLSPEAILKLEGLGFSVGDATQIDLERCKTDHAYLTDCATRLEKLIHELHQYLEGELNVSN